MFNFCLESFATITPPPRQEQMLELILTAAGELLVSVATAIYQYDLRFYTPVDSANSESAGEEVETASGGDGRSSG